MEDRIEEVPVGGVWMDCGRISESSSLTFAIASTSPYPSTEIGHLTLKH